MAFGVDEPQYASQPVGEPESVPVYDVESRAVAAGGGGGPRGSGEGKISALSSTLQGWMLFANIVDEVSPELSGVLSAAGTVVQAAVESGSSELAQGMADELKDMGLPSHIRHEIADALQANVLPFDFKRAVGYYYEAVEGLNDANRVLLRKSPQQFVSAAVDVATNVVSGNLPQAEAASQDLALVIQSLGSADGEWRLMAALEKPKLVPEQACIWCLAPMRRWFGDDVVTHEATYAGLYEETPMARVKSGRVGSAGRDLNEDRPRGYSATILSGPHAYAYALQLQLKDRPGSKPVADIVQHRQQLYAAANLVATTGATLAASAGPLPAVLTGLLGGAAALAVDAVIARLAQCFQSAILPSWVVLHTAMLAPDQIPVSLVLISSPERPVLRLFSAASDSAGGQLQVTDDYEGRHLVQLWNRGRFMRGQSEPPESYRYPTRMFEEVGVRGQPIVINDSDEISNTVRVFVPHMAAPWHPRSHSPAYVSGIRIEVYWKQLPSKE
jgi:hypothetical protein